MCHDDDSHFDDNDYHFSPSLFILCGKSCSGEKKDILQKKNIQLFGVKTGYLILKLPSAKLQTTIIRKTFRNMRELSSSGLADY